tara:strand:- start:823 stop:1386 length:564 start_codon:yes stop_codon:yes gene_type:complete
MSFDISWKNYILNPFTLTMPKSKSAAWQNLVKGHKRGPKRVRLHKKSTTDDNEPIKRIQLIVDCKWSSKHMIVDMTESTLNKLHLKKYQKLARNHSKYHELHQTFSALDHNAFVMRESETIPLVFDTCYGKHTSEVVVTAGKLRNPIATLHIANTKETIEKIAKEKKYVQSIFNKQYKNVVVPVEKM